MKRFELLIILTTVLCGSEALLGQQPAAAAGGRTIWHRLGIPQAYTGIRDGLVNRRGNFPGLERKPPVLKIADPKNLDPSKPEMIQTAAKIKQDQDLKKQKIKALKFLADVNCGCYNKDSKVEAAFLEALDDCDPDVKKQAIESLSEAAGKCTKCRTGCEITCCTEKILKKLDDIANGMEDGCYKEPDKEIRKAAQALYCKCPQPKPKPLPPPEELIAPEPVEPEEIKPKREGSGEEVDPEESEEESEEDSTPVSSRRRLRAQKAVHTGVAVSYSDNSTSQPASTQSDLNEAIAGVIKNAEHLVGCKVVASNPTLGEVVLQLPELYAVQVGWPVILVDDSDNGAIAYVADAGGRRLLLTLEDTNSFSAVPGSNLRMGVIEASPE